MIIITIGSHIRKPFLSVCMNVSTKEMIGKMSISSPGLKLGMIIGRR